VKKTIISFCFLILSFSISYSQEISIIPKPQEIQKTDQHFELTNQTNVVVKGVAESDVSLFLNQLRKQTGFKIPVRKSGSKNSISFEINKSLDIPTEEAYTIEIDQNLVRVVAKNKKGIFNATQSLVQLFPTSFVAADSDNKEKLTLPGVQIKDYPRYDWRGFMLDVSRTFYSVDVVKKYLDVMALFKLNTFHWHLTDDQGWRIEIKKYPKLTSEITTTFHRGHNQPEERSGYYTQDEIKEIVAYAQARNISIVPEIDVPGHSWPTLMAYPELRVNDNTYPHHLFPFYASWGYWGNQFTPNTLDPTKEVVYDFLTDVFTEIAELFPGEYIHFGGDETQHKFWEQEQHVQDFMKENNMENVKELQSYFVQRVSSVIENLGKKPIGWNDILEDYENLPKETAIMSWLGEAAIKEATQHGFKAVAIPSSHVYFDITQEDRDDGTPSDLAYPHINAIDRIYDYNPSKGLTKDEEKLVIGYQANFWSALAQEVKEMNVHVFPRLIAVAEGGWTLPENKDYTDFQKRLETGKERLDALKMDYYKSGGFIVDTWSDKDISEEFQTFSVDVTDKVYTEGRAVAGFFFTEGENFLEIDEVKLYEDDQLISEDLHHALADDFRGTNKIKPFYYNFEIDKYNPKATYRIKAKIRGAGGTDSKGNVTFNLNPYTPFKTVEK